MGEPHLRTGIPSRIKDLLAPKGQKRTKDKNKERICEPAAFDGATS